MMKFTAFIALAAMVACARAQLDVDASGINGTASVSDLIAHGQEARQGQFPYAAKLLWNERSHCSGSLIAPRTILTAAHCVKGDDGKILDVSKYAIYIGNVDYKKAAKYSVKNFFLGPYNIETNYGDIALIELDRAAPQTPVPLAPATLNVERLKILTVLGWGEIPGGTMPDVLQYVKVPYLPFAKCVELAESIELGSIPSDHFCYGPSKSETQPSSCGGDSGGPAVLDAFTKPMQVSLTSYGAKEYKCGGSDNVLSVDTSVSAWRPWIDDTLSLYNLQWQHPPARKNKLLEGRCIEGDTIRTLSTITAGTCCDTCRINSLCKAWTWSRRTQKCYIKKGDGRQTISPICTSGLF